MTMNGSTPHAPAAADAITALRKKPRNFHLAGGFGPALVGVVLFVLMLVLAPSVAPERDVERPVSSSTTTVVSTTTTAVPASTTPVTSP